MINKIKKLIIASFCVILCGVSLSPCSAIERKFGGIFGAQGTNVPGTDSNKEDSLLHTIRIAINWVLGMLSLIALVLCLYAGFRMMTSGGDSKQYSAGFSILKNAAIGLAIIALSRLIVSLIFRLVQGSTETVLENGG